MELTESNIALDMLGPLLAFRIVPGRTRLFFSINHKVVVSSRAFPWTDCSKIVGCEEFVPDGRRWEVDVALNHFPLVSLGNDLAVKGCLRFACDCHFECEGGMARLDDMGLRKRASCREGSRYK